MLIRALEPLEGLEGMRTRRGNRPDLQLTNGPGKLCQAFAIDRRMDKQDLCDPGAKLFLETGLSVSDYVIASSPRIGVRGDEVAVTAPWRFYVEDSQHLSR